MWSSNRGDGRDSIVLGGRSLGSSATTMGSAKLQFSNGNAIAASQFASYTTSMRSTELSSTTGNLFATWMRTLFATTMLYTVLGR